MRAQFRRQLEKNSITSPNLFGVWGIIEAYNNSTDWLDELNNYLRGNADYLTQAVAEHFPDWQMMQPESSYLAWVNISATGRTATELTLDYAGRPAWWLRTAVIMWRMVNSICGLTSVRRAHCWRKR